MNFIDRTLAALGYTKANSKTQYPQFALSMAGAAKWDTPPNPEAVMRLYRQLTWLSTAVDLFSDSLAGVCNFSVKERAGEELEDIPNHDFELLMQDPNPLESEYEFIRNLTSWYKLSGNGVIWMNKSSEFAPPAELWILPSNKVKPVPDGKLFIRGYLVDAGTGTPIPLEPWEVCHIKSFNPFSTFWGLSFIESLMLDGLTDLDQQRWGKSLFSEEGGRMPGVLAFADPIDDNEWNKIKADADRESKRGGLMKLRGVGQGGVQVIGGQISQKDMQFLQQREFTEAEFYKKLAPGAINILSPNVTEANAIAGKAVFQEFGLWPVASLYANRFTKDIMPLYREGLVCEADDFRETNRLVDLQEQAEYSKTHTVNEIRSEYYDDEPLPGGDVPPTEWSAKPAPAPSMNAPTNQPGLDNQPMPPELDTPPDAIQAEMKAWESFAIRRFGKGGREFEPRAIPLVEAVRIKAELKRCTSLAQVKAVFGGGDVMAQAVKELARFNAIAEKRI